MMASEASAPALNLSPDEKRVYKKLYQQADSDTVGVVTGDIAVQFFEKTGLDSRILGEIWQIADKKNRGFLTTAGFSIALRLIGHAQAGREPTYELAFQQGPLPRFEGFALAPAPASSPNQILPPTAPPMEPQGTGNGPVRIPPLTPDKATQYAGLFERQPLQNGSLLPGEAAKQIFEKSGLPNDILGRIWMLADTDQRGALILPEFVIAMHLLASMKQGQLRVLPNILPAGLYEAAARLGSRQQSPTRPQSRSVLPRQLTGQGGGRTASPLGRPTMQARATGGDWLVQPADKARFDQLYDELDKTKKGFITGEEAVPFFSQSNLPEDVLAQIWDLADINSEGCLSRDEFAVAMCLIRQQRNKREGPNPLPTSLPPNLIPPSMRATTRPSSAASPFDVPGSAATAPVQAQAKPSTLDDLFGLDDSMPPAPQQLPHPTGGSINDPFSSRASPVTPSSPIRPSATGNVFKSFIPSSSFGRGLSAQVTGGSNSSASGLSKPAPCAATGDDDLLGDTEPDAKDLNNPSTELANLSNQIGSLTKQVQVVQGQRTIAQKELSQISAQKKTFEQRLTQLRAMYEKEAQDVQSLQAQLTSSRSESRKIQTDMAILDGSYQDLQNQHQTILAALQADQQENNNLKERMRTVNAEIAQLKPQLEKLRSEARQQKGLVAINRKQLIINEGERDKLKTEGNDLMKANEEMARHDVTDSVAQHVSSPAVSTNGANNPFFKRTGSTDAAGTFTPSASRSFSGKSLDDLFGGGSLTGTPPPVAPASFNKPQNTGTSTNSAASFATPTSGTPNISRQPTFTVEPPEPPEPDQINSSSLPFHDASTSLSSSRQVSPPLSRLGLGDTPGDSPARYELAPSPLTATPTGQSASSALGSEGRTTASALMSTEADPASNTNSTEDTIDALTSKDPFSTLDQNKAKEEFESAFASFKNSHSKSSTSAATKATPAFSKFNTEFPPISSLEKNDISESDSDRGGFDDDFAPLSPPSRNIEKKTEQANISNQPTASGILPSASVAAVADHNNADSKAHGLFGSAAAPSAGFPTSAPENQPSTTSTIPKGKFHDFDDDDFEGLEDAQEASADDDYANVSRTGLEDHNHAFDNDSPHGSQKSQFATTSVPFGTKNSLDLTSVSAPSATESAKAAPTILSDKNGPVVPDSHDWDAIFANLDETPAQSQPHGSGYSTARPTARPEGANRTCTEEGTSDDPILKNLTTMGYSRADALSALEKYDYNLERAADYLASQS